MNWYIGAFQQYVQFSGRARRKEYWYFVLFNLLVTAALSVTDNALGLGSLESGAGMLTSLYGLIAFLPGLALSVRRLHDTGRSGWWILINFVPLIGMFVFLYFMIVDGDAGANQYGPSPKAGMTLAAA